ncbi:MAG: GntR family transcriptional regulator [Oscillospiraceae bacterium]|nr:GntR family transcriptional regulator [Oscillospiraceae bacterium]
MDQRQNARPRDEATEHIECYIKQKNLAVHGKLPSERDMCEMWGFNRTTLRSAIKRLIEEGKLYNLKGSGTYVAPPKLERDLQDAKSITESVRDTGHYVETQILEREIVECNKHISKKLQLPIGHKLFCMRRLRLLDGEPYMIENNYIDYERIPDIEAYDFAEESFYNVLSYYGAVVTQGYETVGITYATQEEAELLKLQEGEAMFYLSGVSYESEERPLEYFKSVTRADKVRFSSVLTRQAPDAERSEER